MPGFASLRCTILPSIRRQIGLVLLSSVANISTASTSSSAMQSINACECTRASSVSTSLLALLYDVFIFFTMAFDISAVPWPIIIACVNSLCIVLANFLRLSHMRSEKSLPSGAHGE